MSKKKTTSPTKKIKELGGNETKEQSDYDIAPPAFKDDYEEYKTLLFNAFRIKRMGYDAQQMFKNLIIENNGAGILPDETVARVYPVGGELDDYGNSKYLEFTFPNGKSFRRLNIRNSEPPPSYGGYLVTGLPCGIAYSDIIRKSVDTMKLCDEVIWQNLNAVKTAKVITVKDANALLSIKQAVRKIQAGAPIVEVSPSLADALKAIDVSTPFIAPQIGEFKRTIKDELLIRIGTMSANTFKRERVQSTEVNATVGQCEDYIYSLIDNINAQFKSFNLPYEAVLNNSLEELYAGGIYDPVEPQIQENNND